MRWSLYLGIIVGSAPSLASASPASTVNGSRSPDGMYSFTVEAHAEKPGGEQHRIVIRRRGSAAPIARIERPAGSNPEVRFVGDHNLLVEVGCGSNCVLATVFAPTGKALASLGTASAISADASWGVGFQSFDRAYGNDDDEVSLVDLRTGREHRSKHAGAWNTCHVRWTREHATLLPCDARTAPIVLSLPARQR